ncbi:pentatricopeptide repeat-containing protein At4g39620, chloroplastic-like isoform X1 [Rutidosis leptorrhynchoides]|uniref:pentatricopeptide repeat-containing protein At4g39620, chloroplastic-like isoform X1 n=1 Tax=Rutidosis leptorrhynchoides TaxID=125765 RepID=UPI003A99EF79
MAMNIYSSPMRNQFLQITSSDPFEINKIHFHLRYKTTTIITCGLRKPLRTRRRSDGVLSTEAIQAVQSLKLAAKNQSKLDQVFNSKLNRLLKDDLLDAFAELQRQQHLDLALKVFEFMRKEAWYEPDHSLYGDLMLMFGKKKAIDKVERLFSELMEEGLKPDTRTYTELIGAYLKVDMIDKAMETYELMKASGCTPDELTLTIMIRNLESAGRDELVAIVKNDCAKYVDSPKTFLKEVARKYPKRLRLNLV